MAQTPRKTRTQTTGQARQHSKRQSVERRLKDLLSKSGLTDADKHEILSAEIDKLAESNMVLMPNMTQVLARRTLGCGGAAPVRYTKQPDGSYIKWCLQPNCSYVPCGTYPVGATPAFEV